MKTYQQWALLAAGFALAGLTPAMAFADDKKDDAPPRGSIAEVLRLRDQLPRTQVNVSEAVLQDGKIDVSRQTVVQVPVSTVVEVIGPDGNKVQMVTTTMVTQARQTKFSVEAKAIKSFSVTKDGKLEPLDADKLADLLKKPAAVLVGETADVDARSLELIKPGTVYLAVPPALSQPLPPMPLDEKPRPIP